MAASQFHPLVEQWFTDAFGGPTRAQQLGWAPIRAGRHTLIAAPTGSGKTLAAFLTAIDELVREGLSNRLPDEVRILYVSPLKALSADVHKNLTEPLSSICRLAAAQGLEPPRITAAVRTGDTTSGARAAMLRRPPHIVITTPESLYLLLTSPASREMLRSVRMVIIDEIHAVIGTRRGAHLSLSLERLERVARRSPLRLGLSATQRPIEEVACWLSGTVGPPCAIVNEGHTRAMDLAIETPQSDLDAVMSNEVWTEYYDRLAQLIQAHRTTLVFVNTRKMAERLARHLTDRLGEDAVTAHHGSLSKETRLDAEARLKAGSLRALVATASLELGIDIGHVDLVCQIGSPRRISTLVQRVGRSGHTVQGVSKGRLFPVSRDDLLECAALLRALRHGELDNVPRHDRPLDVLAQQIVAEAACDEAGTTAEDDLFALVRRAWPYRDLSRSDFDAVVKMVAEGFSTRRGRRAALLHRDEVHATVRGRRGARLLAQTSGGAIPDLADYRVILDPDETLIGTLNEDFAIESNAGDIFQLGNASWRILQVTTGTVRVADAKGAPPTIPFWLGEAPARSDELSRAVSDLRREVDGRLSAAGRSPDVTDADVGWLMERTALGVGPARSLLSYLAGGRGALQAIPTQETLVVERFFDESGGMQLVIHAPFGSRINKAWCLALRKRFCRQFNFELQAAATEDALLLSLGPQHSFPLADVFRYLHPDSVRDILVQALLDAPVFKTRWRWSTTLALAVPRTRGGRRMPPQLQRILADDLLAAAFPDAAACLENIPGDRQIPDHPLVNQALRDCLEEAMDFGGLQAVLERIQRGELTLLARDTPEPSLFAHEILTARPYAFLDDAPLEERRTQAVQTRRSASASTDETGLLDPAAVDRVRQEARPTARDPDELHDALMTAGVLTRADAACLESSWVESLLRTGRATWVNLDPTALLVASERLPELRALHPALSVNPSVAVPVPRGSRVWTPEDALTELVRSRLTMEGPSTAAALGSVFQVSSASVEASLLVLEADGVVLRGAFTREGVLARAHGGPVEWCDRALLARIHRYTLNRLRAEIEPVTPADFMQFLFAWQHVDSATRLSGLDGLREAISLLDGFELAAAAWERAVLPVRMDHYDPALLDMLCLTGEVGWARFSAPRVLKFGPVTPIALFLREHAELWRSMRAPADAAVDASLTADARTVLAHLDSRGASFFDDLASATQFDIYRLREALGILVAVGRVTSDGFAGLRGLIEAARGRPIRRPHRRDLSGRWATLSGADQAAEVAGIELQARILLSRYGIMFRRLLTRETGAAPWRELVRVYRRLEARGEIRGGRFVSGAAGEQFALPEAVTQLRELRRHPRSGHVCVICTADPLNLSGIVTAGERIRAAGSNQMAYRDGTPIAVMERGSLRALVPLGRDEEADLWRVLSRRRVSRVA
jgi:ATP-dependent Lhr-like helicase